MKTLSIDIGGSSIKSMVLGSNGIPITDRVVFPTLKPSTPKSILETIKKCTLQLGAFDRISVGFPGVVSNGIVYTAPNLHKHWENFPLSKELTHTYHKPSQVINDAGMQGLAVIEGSGIELVLTLGTGFGSALYFEGVYIPNLQLAHHIIKKKLTYEDYIGQKALEKMGKKKWLKRVQEVVHSLKPVFNPRVFYIGGGNARFLKSHLFDEKVIVIDNLAGILGGAKLWK